MTDIYRQYKVQIIVNDQYHETIACNKIQPCYKNYYLNLLNCLGCDISHPPLGELLRKINNLKGNWLVVSPTYWQATHNDVIVLAAGENLQLNSQESHHYFNILQNFFQAKNMLFFYHDPHTWLLNIDNTPPICSTPLYAIMHKSMYQMLFSLDATQFWQQMHTEIQMLLNSQINIKINGLWLWGEGSLQVNSNKIVITDDPNLANVLSDYHIEIIPLTNIAKLKKNNLISITYPTITTLQYLQATNQKHHMQWYWNNIAYMQRAERTLFTTIFSI